MNLTKKQIDVIRSMTPVKLKGQQVSFVCTLGYFQPLGANWSYVAGYINYKGLNILVVTRFGEIM